MPNQYYDFLFKPVLSLLNIKPAAAKALARLGIETVRDMLFYLPVRYNQIIDGANILTIQSETEVQVKIIIEDVSLIDYKTPKIYAITESGYHIILRFFNPLPAFLRLRLRPGTKCIASGKLQRFDKEIQLLHPDFSFDQQEIPLLEPIYRLTYALSMRQLHGYITKVFNAFKGFCKLYIADNYAKTKQKYPLSDLTPQRYLYEVIEALRLIHAIDLEAADTKQATSWISFAYNSLKHKELFANQMMWQLLKMQELQTHGHCYQIHKTIQVKILEHLGFVLTGAQEQAIKEIEADQASNRQMMRLLQGDVGSGKTIVALLTMVNVVASKAQCALMAPTDLLSLQHYVFFCKALGDFGINIAILTGKTGKKQRQQIATGLLSGEIQILIGTHALFQEQVQFKNLGYVVIDEQHRFGVEQRTDLINKATNPDVMVMTATPIPRSLAMTMFGDMSITAITEKPKNRLPIFTEMMDISASSKLRSLIAKAIENDERVYWICPLIDQKDRQELEEDKAKASYADATNRANKMQELFPGKVALLHGRMKSAEKEQVMEIFKSGALPILVSTTVIEVGIDVPEATLIIIENAEKFGLAQLHQLRGRVGRGSKASSCILLYNKANLTYFGEQRLKTMCNSTDGFYIAEQDLKLRGSGELLGTKQSGEANFYFFDLSQDHNYNLLNQIEQQVQKIVQRPLSNEAQAFLQMQGKLFAREQKAL
jgi:ATP-dependent DNA helicase RecG